MSSGMMESFCPLCAKSGITRRIKAFQINLEEAMWACEGEDCTWPIGYEELLFFNRPAISCNWEDSSSTKEDTSALIELSLYTPPVTPGGELSKELSDIASTEYSLNPPAEDKVGILSHCESSEESTNSTKSLFELIEVGSVNSTEENKSIMNELIEGVRTLPKITNIEKTKINIQIYSNINERVKRETWKHEHSLMSVSITDSFKNLDSSGNACAEFGLSMQHEIGGEQNESGRLQSSTPVSGVETNFGAATSEAITQDINDIMNTSNLSNVSANMSDSYMDKLLGDILNNESQVLVANETEWLNDLFS